MADETTQVPQADQETADSEVEETEESIADMLREPYQALVEARRQAMATAGAVADSAGAVRHVMGYLGPPLERLVLEIGNVVELLEEQQATPLEEDEDDDDDVLRLPYGEAIGMYLLMQQASQLLAQASQTKLGDERTAYEATAQELMRMVGVMQEVDPELPELAQEAIAEAQKAQAGEGTEP